MCPRSSGMGFPCAGIKTPKSVRALQEFLAHVKLMLKLPFFWCLHVLNLSNEGLSSKNHSDHHDLAADRPSPLLVPVPITSLVDQVELIKKKLSVIEFGTFIERLDMQMEEEHAECAICLSRLERSHEIRELSNCFHAFHRHCLDEWVDKGQVTCPLCRTKLLPHHHGKDGKGGGGDPWRVERIAYLFGEDSVMANFCCNM
uniref:Putative E3 ubiquitin-protein ligase RHA1B-like n=1 Tax=Davidia involucrata TaxID=16924 RepID=A0A5B7C8R4_DAVIN